MHAMMPVIPRSASRKVNGYVKAVLALDAVRKKREARYDRVASVSRTASHEGTASSRVYGRMRTSGPPPIPLIPA